MSSASGEPQPHVSSIASVVDLHPKLEGTAEGFVSHMMQLLDKDQTRLAAKITGLRQELMTTERYLHEARRARDMLEATMEALSELGD